MRILIDGVERELELEAVIVAGYTGRDRSAVMQHIEELAALGVPPPSSVPAYWIFPPHLATTAATTSVTGATTSGEAEVCLLVDGEDVFVTVASDHTDRAVEALDVGLSKAICQKPIAAEAWPIDVVEGRWDELVLRSWIEESGVEVPYQDGTCAALVPPPELLAGVPFDPLRRFALLTGTVPVIGGIRPSGGFRAELVDPGCGRSIHLRYGVTTLGAPTADRTRS